MVDEIKENIKGRIIVVVGIFSFLFLMAYLISTNRSTDEFQDYYNKTQIDEFLTRNYTVEYDEGEYDYCVEWEGFNKGTLHRSNLLYTCYNLAQNIFYCDYDIQKDGRLMVKAILNTTYNEDGEIIGLEYDEPNYFNCTRWVKSKRLK